MSNALETDNGAAVGEDRDAVLRKVRGKALTRQRRDRVARWALPAGVILGLLVIWQIYGMVHGFNPLFFSYPSQIGDGIAYYAQHSLLEDLATSGSEWALGMLIALTAVPIGLLIGSSRRVVYAVDPLFDGLYATPMIALTPLFIIWFGLGISSKVAIAALIAFFPLAITVIQGMATVDAELLNAVRSLGASRIQIYRDVIAPAVLPFIFTGLRLAIRSALIGVVLGEFIGGTSGVGFRIQQFANAFQTPRYLGGVVILIVFAIIVNYLLRVLSRKIAPWQRNVNP